MLCESGMISRAFVFIIKPNFYVLFLQVYVSDFVPFMLFAFKTFLGQFHIFLNINLNFKYWTHNNLPVWKVVEIIIYSFKQFSFRSGTRLFHYAALKL